MAKKGKTIRKSKKKTKARKLIELVRNDASAFLSSEEGKIVKKDIIKAAITLGLAAAAAGSADAQNHTNAPHQDYGHSDSPHVDAVTLRVQNRLGIAQHNSGHSNAAHSNIPAHNDAHTDHSNHGSHSSGGWC
jgi:hypothetical protein